MKWYVKSAPKQKWTCITPIFRPKFVEINNDLCILLN